RRRHRERITLGARGSQRAKRMERNRADVRKRGYVLMLPEISTELRETMYDIADALRYPVDHRGRVYDVRYLIHVLSFHLARAGCVIDPDRAQIKARRLPPMPGVFDDAVEWVHPDAPSSIDDELAGATLDDIET